MNIVLAKSNIEIKPNEQKYDVAPNLLTGDGLHSASPYATEYEFIKMLYWLIIAKGHHRILEIGTNRGYSTWWFLKAAEKIGGHVTTVDAYDLYAGEDSDNLKRVISTSQDFFAKIRDIDVFDFIYVDGDHSFLPAYLDIFNAQKIISPGGTIAVHDTRYNDGKEVYQVDKALLEIMRDTHGKWMFYNFGHGLALGEF